MQKISVEDFIGNVRFNHDGLVPVIAQQFDSGEVLMMAWMNEEALKETIRTNRMCYYPDPGNNYGEKEKHPAIHKN